MTLKEKLINSPSQVANPTGCRIEDSTLKEMRASHNAIGRLSATRFMDARCLSLGTFNRVLLRGAVSAPFPHSVPVLLLDSGGLTPVFGLQAPTC